MKIVIAISIIILSVINIIAYLIFKHTVKKHQVFEIDIETKEQIKNINLIRNIAIKIRTTPALLALLILQPVIIYGFVSQDIERAKIIQNPKLVYAEITQKYKKKYEEKIYYYVDYDFIISTPNLSSVSYNGTGKINEKNFNNIDNNTQLKVTYNVNNPHESQIGDITKLTLGTMITNRIFPYSCLAGMYFLTLFGTYYILFKLRIKKASNTQLTKCK